MIRVNEKYYMKSIHEKVMVKGLIYDNGSFEYIVETKDEIELITDYKDLIYICHGY